MKKSLLLLAALGLAPSLALAKDPGTGVAPNGDALVSSPAFAADGVPVDMFNVVRAETAKYLAEETIVSGGNVLRHERNGIDLDNQTVVRSNFDLYYSYGVFDASAGLKITLPDHDLYQSIEIIDENHIILGVVYPGQTVEISPDKLSFGEHVYVFMRTQRRTGDAKGLEELAKRQDAPVIEQGSAKPYVSEVKYEPNSLNALRADLLARSVKNPEIAHPELGFVTDVWDITFPAYQIADVLGWGGLPTSGAHYISLQPSDDAAAQGGCSSMTFAKPDLQYDRNGYWSVTVYNREGWVKTKNFKINSLTAKPNSDGSYTIHFNCGADALNNLDVVPGWNGLMRNYLPVSTDGIVAYGKALAAESPIKTVK